jgi:predicted nuclease of restriction endonuclease-like (RecB) superfamily
MDILRIENELFSDIRILIEDSKHRIASMFDSEKTILYWNVGQRVRVDVLGNSRAKYGGRILEGLSVRLISEYGRGWSVQQLRHCLKIANVVDSEEILYTLCRELSWSHLRTIMYIEEPIKREFYIEMTRLNRWDVRTLQKQKEQLLFERTAISKQPIEVIGSELAKLKTEKILSPDIVFHDPVFLSCLGVADFGSEKDLEDAIIAELQNFIQEMGSDFAFLARQKTIMIDNKDYALDLLFLHRRLRCLVVIDLKLGNFDASYKGEMELYLRWLEKYEMIPGENAPIGLILCSGKNEEHVELMRLEESNIRIAEYLTKLPDMKLLEAKLKLSIERAREKIAEQTDVNKEYNMKQPDI